MPFRAPPTKVNLPDVRVFAQIAGGSLQDQMAASREFGWSTPALSGAGIRRGDRSQRGRGACRNGKQPARLLRTVMANEEPLRVVASPTAAPLHRDLLQQLGAKSILMVPVSTGTERLGVLAVSSDQVMGEEWVSFVKAIGSHIGHVLVFARA